MRRLFFIISLVLLFNIVFAKDIAPTLSMGERLFKKSLSYKLKDFNFNWKVSFFTVVTFSVIFGEEKRDLTFKELNTIFKTDNRVYSSKDKRDILYLANLMKNRKNYKIQTGFGPWGRSYFVAIFIDNKGKMYALENIGELKDMLGVIDTPAEMLVWLRLKYFENPYSYLYRYNIWRLRYSLWSLGACYYSEFIKEYDSNGNFMKRKKVKSYHKKGCVDPVI